MKNERRIAVIDLLRGVAVLLMLGYHTVVSFGWYYRITPFDTLFGLLKDGAPQLISSLFILVSGICSYYSSSNIKRGLRVTGCAAGITLVTAVILPALGMSGLDIYFGILHFLGCAMLLSPLLKKLAEHIPATAGIPLMLILFAFTREISEGFLGFGGSLSIRLPDSLRQAGFLFPIGIYSDSFYSSDYYPLLPWLFLFTVGIYLGSLLKRSQLRESAYRKTVPFVEFIGRHALIIYIAHTPAIYAAGYIISLTMN